MNAEVKFESLGRDGITPVGVYLIDVALRFGIKIEDACGGNLIGNEIVIKITKGGELLSKPTKLELEHLTAERRKNGERLFSQAKIEKSGEIWVMTTEKQKPTPTTFEAFEKEFAELPLDQKIQHLLELEKTALSETLNYIISLPSLIGEKLRDTVAEFGYKIEEEEQKAKTPAEHKEEVKEQAKEEKSEATPAVPKAKKTTTRTATPKAEAKPKAAPKKPTTRKRVTKTDKPTTE